LIPRILETEVMDTLEEAEGYDAMDHREVNARFVDDLLAALPDSVERRRLQVLDSGTGTALIPIEILKRRNDLRIVAVDMAENMLAIARKNVCAAGLEAAITLESADAKALPYTDATFDAVISNSIVHHIPRPVEALREMRRVLKPGGLLFVRDLLRPDDDRGVEELVSRYAADADAAQRGMFRDSLRAALTLPEVQSLLREIGFDTAAVRQTSDRHWTIIARRD
jgi:ubiquinone/menaquinone biosynthesis C-methylase UbiE